MVLENLIKDKDRIISLYNNGMLQREIAEIYNTSATSIARLLRSQGITSKIVVSNSDETEIVNLYNNGSTIKEISKIFNFGERRVSNILKKYDVTILKSYERPSKYTLDENYFDEINTQDKAYLLGLLYADGTNRGNCFEISLQERDKDILDKMNNAIGSNRNLSFIDYSSKNPNYQNQYSLHVYNRHMCEQLSLHGMVKRKSLILKFPKWLNENLYSHFIRGYFDGDGFVSKDYKNAKSSIVSTEDFCKAVQNILKEKLCINSYIYLCHNNINTTTRTLQISGRNQIRKFLDYIYYDANLYLKRKYEIYESLYKLKNIDSTLTE